MLFQDSQFKIRRAAVFLRACIASQVSLQLKLLPWCCHSDRQARTFHHVAALVYLFLISVEHRALYDLRFLSSGAMCGWNSCSWVNSRWVCRRFINHHRNSHPVTSVTLPINPISSAETKGGHSFLVLFMVSARL